MKLGTVERKLQCLDRYRTKHIHVGKVIVANDRNVVDGAYKSVQTKKKGEGGYEAVPELWCGTLR